MILLLLLLPGLLGDTAPHPGPDPHVSQTKRSNWGESQKKISSFTWSTRAAHPQQCSTFLLVGESAPAASPLPEQNLHRFDAHYYILKHHFWKLILVWDLIVFILSLFPWCLPEWHSPSSTLWRTSTTGSTATTTTTTTRTSTSSNLSTLLSPATSMLLIRSNLWFLMQSLMLLCHCKHLFQINVMNVAGRRRRRRMAERAQLKWKGCVSKIHQVVLCQILKLHLPLSHQEGGKRQQVPLERGLKQF